MVRCFALAEAGSGLGAKDLAWKIASWVSARGVTTLIIDTANNGQGARTMEDVASRLDHLDGEFLTGYISQTGRERYGIITCRTKIETAVLNKLANCYDLILFVLNADSLPLISEFSPSVPSLIKVALHDDKAIVQAGRLADRMLAEATLPHPEGFVLDGGDNTVAARLAHRWRIAFWGFADDYPHIADRVLDRAAPLNTSQTHEPKPQLVTASTNDKNDLDTIAKDVLEALRREPQFKNIRVPFGDTDALERLKRQVASAARRLIGEIAHEVLSAKARDALVVRVVDDSVGFGPIEALLSDPKVTEIMVNGADKIYIERAGSVSLLSASFSDNSHLLAVIDRMLSTAGRRIDEASPMVDARLPDGSRLNVIIPPLAIDGPTVTIRRFSKQVQSIEDAVANKMLTRETADFLSQCVRSRISVIISGGTGAGKTTLLNLLSSAINPAERVVTIEDAAELSLNLPHVVRLESRPPSLDGTGQVTIRDLVRNALRMRPDRIVVGECRGAEALDMLQAMNTGHEGSLTTVHANSPRDALSRIETMVLMAGMDLPLASVREQVSRAINLIVQVARMSNGARRVVEIAEVAEIMEGGAPCIHTIATLPSEDRELEGSGSTPQFAEKLHAKGVELPQL